MLEAPTAPGLPHGWRDVVLGDLGEFSTSSVDKKVNTAELPVRLVNYMDVYRSPYLTSQLDYMQVTASRPEIAKSQVLVGDVLFTPSSETPDDVGHSAVVVEALPETLHSYHTVRLRIAPSEAIDLRFRGRFANSSLVLKHFEKCATGSTRYTLSLADFRSAPVRIPPIAEQTKIAQVLDTLDTTIRQTEAIIEKLKQVKQGLLHDLLTRGIDANGELRPPHSQAPHLYKASPLGWIPREWDVLQLRDVGESVTGSTPPSVDPLAWGAGWPFITPVDVLEDRDIDSAERSVSSRGAAYVRLLPPKTTLVVCIGSTIGKVGITTVEACTNQQINALVPSKNMAPEFVYLAVHRHVEQLRAMAGLQAVPIVNKTSFESMVIPIAPFVEQTEIARRMASISARIRQEDASVTKMRALKSGLMDDLLTGRVRVTPLLQPEAAP